MSNSTNTILLKYDNVQTTLLKYDNVQTTIMKPIVGDIVYLPIATTSNLGVIQVGETLEITELGVLDINKENAAELLNGSMEALALLPYDETFEYSLGALIIDSSGQLYKSLIIDNLGNALSDTDYWEHISMMTNAEVLALISEHNTSPTAHGNILDLLSTFQTKSNLVTSFSLIPLDTKYPSEKLVKGYIDDAVNKAIIYKGSWDTTDQIDYSSLNSYRPIKAGWRFECTGTGCTIDGEEYNPKDYITFNTDINESTDIITSMIDKTDNTDLVDSVNGYKGIVVLTKADIELGNVDNTSDLDKPVSTATLNALDGKVNIYDNDTETPSVGSIINEGGNTIVQRENTGKKGFINVGVNGGVQPYVVLGIQNIGSFANYIQITDTDLLKHTIRIGDTFYYYNILDTSTGLTKAEQTLTSEEQSQIQTNLAVEPMFPTPIVTSRQYLYYENGNRYVGATNYNLTGTVLITGWTGEDAPYTQAITVEGILATDTPIIDLDLSEVAYADIADTQSAYGVIYRAVASADTITLYASEVPAKDLNLLIKVVR